MKQLQLLKMMKHAITLKNTHDTIGSRETEYTPTQVILKLW